MSGLNYSSVLFHSIQQALIKLAALQVAADMEMNDPRSFPLRSSQVHMENKDKHIKTTHRDKGNDRGQRWDQKMINHLLVWQ